MYAMKGPQRLCLLQTEAAIDHIRILTFLLLEVAYADAPHPFYITPSAGYPPFLDLAIPLSLLRPPGLSPARPPALAPDAVLSTTLLPTGASASRTGITKNSVLISWSSWSDDILS